MRAVAIIPARYGAQRFPGKPLARDTGQYLIEHVWRRACEARRVSRVIVATDDERIAAACREFGAECAMTPADCPSGTDRVARVAAGIDCDLVVNVQGDEPEMPPENVDRLCALMAESDAPMGTLAIETDDPGAWASPNVVKVAFAAGSGTGTGSGSGADMGGVVRGRALYFSRAGIPYDRASGGKPGRFWKHLGIYAYRKDFLARVAALEPSPLERTEMLEQLRVLEAGFPIAVAAAAAESGGIDTPEQYAEFVVRWRIQHG